MRRGAEHCALRAIRRSALDRRLRSSLSRSKASIDCHSLRHRLRPRPHPLRCRGRSRYLSADARRMCSPMPRPRWVEARPLPAPVPSSSWAAAQAQPRLSSQLCAHQLRQVRQLSLHPTVRSKRESESSLNFWRVCQPYKVAAQPSPRRWRSFTEQHARPSPRDVAATTTWSHIASTEAKRVSRVEY